MLEIISFAVIVFSPFHPQREVEEPEVTPERYNHVNAPA
jgi:hypothetical protein